MGILDQQMRLSNRAVNGRDIDIGEMFADGHNVSLSQQLLSDEGRKTSGYFSGEIQGGSDRRINMYPNNLDPAAPNTDYKGRERIRAPKPPNPPVEPPPVIDDVIDE